MPEGTKINFLDEKTINELHQKNRIDLPQLGLQDNKEQLTTDLVMTYENPLWRDIMYAQLYRQAAALSFMADGKEYVMLEFQKPSDDEADKLVANCHEVHEYIGQLEFNLKLDHLPVRSVWDVTEDEGAADGLVEKERVYSLMRYKRKIKRNLRRQKDLVVVGFKAYRSGRLLEHVDQLSSQFDNKELLARYTEWLNTIE
ncbi:MAG: hypothetical protein ABF624_10525 [Liquorilactobacillus ghanensis]|uniref:hypothetical protein n=1 Tax=Liquorilactobacillus ghanensis TaxID=399370 RepID=UPI0039EB9617